MLEDSVRLFLLRIGLADMPFGESGQEIIRITPDQLPLCYTLLQEIFHAEELNTLAEMQADLSAPASIDSTQQFVILARQADIQGQNKSLNPIASLIVGCYLSLSNLEPSDRSIGFIEYLGTANAFRNRGYASAMLKTFEAIMLSIASIRKEQLCLIMGEVEPDLVDFKVKRGYHQPRGSQYSQPPISCDKQTGLPISAALPKYLMVKSWTGAVEADLLLHAVQTVFEKRYVPRNMDKQSKRRVNDYIYEHVYAPFSASLQVELGNVIMN
jgi:hypothetical protein